MKWTKWDTIVHDFWVHCVLRDYMRCPKCKAVGTYKAHPPPFVRRWLCKYCGYFKCPDQQGNVYEGQCHPEKEGTWDGRAVWQLIPRDHPNAQPTPKEVVDQIGCNPWFG
jgi:hypothetical protein